MNTLIETLAKQAGMVKYPTGLGISENTIWGDRNIEQFAKLIIQKAGEAFWSEDCHASDLAYEEYYRNRKKINQHFGVE
ncbi:hypothetical protein UFOVP116_174 [uncultured Caudovirales phage]|uniref:Uncharacterized protein n=1 Tax=uncultured Caudovirales phage TaxID=2100421 RepID=A0A6J5LE43_9CAUD|nr:hypothetical protein UFOVP116_174 [uncultured Caudovirales phage]